MYLDESKVSIEKSTSFENIDKKFVKSQEEMFTLMKSYTDLGYELEVDTIVEKYDFESDRIIGYEIVIYKKRK